MNRSIGCQEGRQEELEWLAEQPLRGQLEELWEELWDQGQLQQCGLGEPCDCLIVLGRRVDRDLPCCLERIRFCIVLAEGAC